MSLHYRIAMNLDAAQVSSLAFSLCGTKLAAGTEDGDILVWDTKTGQPYYPVLSPPDKSLVSGCSSVLWINSSSFVCGFADGYIATCQLRQELSNDQESQPRLYLLRRQAVDAPVHLLSYQPNTSCLAISTEKNVRFWLRKADALDWVHYRRLRDPPVIEETRSRPLRVTSCAWTSQPNQLIVSYLHNGIIIWDIQTETALKSFNMGGLIYGGAWCSEVSKFVAINKLRKLDIYDIMSSGLIWSPDEPCDVAFVQAIHSGSAFIAGGHGRAKIIDVAGTRVSQILQEETLPSEPMGKTSTIAGYQDAEEEVFMIAIASRTKCAVWRAISQEELSGIHDLGLMIRETGEGHDITPSRLGWFSVFTNILGR